METQRGAGVEVEIDVMNQVKAPKDREFVRQDVPEIDAVIHHQERNDVTAPGRQRQPLRKADAAPFDEAGERGDDRRLEQLHRAERTGAENDVADAALRFGLGRLTQTPAPLGQQDRDCGGTHEGRGEQGAEFGHVA